MYTDEEINRSYPASSRLIFLSYLNVNICYFDHEFRILLILQL